MITVRCGWWGQGVYMWVVGKLKEFLITINTHIQIHTHSLSSSMTHFLVYFITLSCPAPPRPTPFRPYTFGASQHAYEGYIVGRSKSVLGPVLMRGRNGSPVPSLSPSPAQATLAATHPVAEPPAHSQVCGRQRYRLEGRVWELGEGVVGYLLFSESHSMKFRSLRERCGTSTTMGGVTS